MVRQPAGVQPAWAHAASNIAEESAGAHRCPDSGAPRSNTRASASKLFLLPLALSCHFALARPEHPRLHRPAKLFDAAPHGKASIEQILDGGPPGRGLPMQHVVTGMRPPPWAGEHGRQQLQPMEPGVGLDAMRSGHMPALMCQRVTGIDGKWGLLCKPLPASNTTGMNETQVQNAQRIARELAQQAHLLNAPNTAKPVMHRIQQVYDWQKSSTFTYIQHKKHYYNVHYADSSALKIETGLDVCGLGPFRFYTRFGLITEAVSGRPGADLQGADGILGFGYTDLPRSASLMKTLTRRARPNWNLVQPNNMKLMANNSFAVLSSVDSGELMLGGFDPAAVVGQVEWVPMVNLTGYGVNITSVTYGGKELLVLGERGLHAGGTMGVFDTGSTCLNLPRGLFNGYYKSSLFDNFAALASTDPTLPIVITLNGRVKLEIPQSSWSEPWACTYPFEQSNVVLLGHHIFRAYMVIHDMNPPHYHMGFAKIAPDYIMSTGTSVTVPLKGQRPFEEREGVVTVAKVPLTLEQRVHLFISISLGTPPQTFRCVFDTGSVLLAVFSGNVSTGMVAKKTNKVMHVDEPSVPPLTSVAAVAAPPKVPRPTRPPHLHLASHPLSATSRALAANTEKRKVAARAQETGSPPEGTTHIERIVLYDAGGALAVICCVVIGRLIYTRITRKSSAAGG